MTHNVKKSNAP